MSEAARPDDAAAGVGEARELPQSGASRSGDDADRLASELVARLGEESATLGTAESLTAGMLAAAVCGVPGASSVYLGGVVSYANAVKADLLGVDPELLERCGSVDPEVALAMAEGVRTACGTDYGISTTGVAGPAAHDGKPVGRVYLGVAGPGVARSVELDLRGDRARIRSETVERALRLLLEELPTSS